MSYVRKSSNAPRNPVAMPARQRHAGPHGGGIKQVRQAAARELRRALEVP